MQKIFPVCSNSRQKETRTAEDKLPNLIYRSLIFGDAENHLNQDAIASLAADRCAWRKFVVACSAAEWMNDDCTDETRWVEPNSMWQHPSYATVAYRQNAVACGNTQVTRTVCNRSFDWALPMHGTWPQRHVFSTWRSPSGRSIECNSLGLCCQYTQT